MKARSLTILRMITQIYMGRVAQVGSLGPFLVCGGDIAAHLGLPATRLGGQRFVKVADSVYNRFAGGDPHRLIFPDNNEDGNPV
jgi:hypothetical protein